MFGGLASLFLTLVVLSVHSGVIFEEEFETSSKWTKSTKIGDVGNMELSKRKAVTSASAQGFKTMQDSKFYHYSAPLDGEFQTAGKDFLFEFLARHEQSISCGGAYLKLLLDNNGKEFDGQSEYAIMFGPDVCGMEKRIHLIFSYGGKNILRSTDIDYEVDSKLHLYSVIIKKDKSYNVLVDGVSKAHGKIIDDFEIFGKSEIDDPNDVKPDTWVDEAEIPDPKAEKPEDWDKPEFITDEDSKKPEDWNDADDGEWTAPTKPNPDYKGTWSAPMINNPDYKGPFVAKKIPNPEYKEDPSYCEYTIKAVGIDVWQVQAGTNFDSIYITDDLDLGAEHTRASVKIVNTENEAQSQSEENSKDKPENEDEEEDDKADEL